MNTNEAVLEKVYKLLSLHKQGLLGGEHMPEDENPGLDIGSKQNYLYFTLPMALNYQRNSYVLWKCANQMYAADEGLSVFNSYEVCRMPEDDLRKILVKYKVALQPNKQPLIWKKLCETIETRFGGDIRQLFVANDYSIKRVKEHIQQNKKDYPYLSGNKICNYWLFVLEQYTDVSFIDRENITVAPDTHVIQASHRLGLLTNEEMHLSNVQAIVAERWAALLKETGLVPIDVHTPLWLWSRGKFEVPI